MKSKELQKYNEKLYEDVAVASEKCDGIISNFSMGALGILLVFLKDIVPVNKAVCVWLLRYSWVFFGFAVTFIILTYPLLQIGTYIRLNGIKRENDGSYIYDKLIKIFNVLGVVFFVAGIWFAIVFFYKNIGWGN